MGRNDKSMVDELFECSTEVLQQKILRLKVKNIGLEKKLKRERKKEHERKEEFHSLNEKYEHCKLELVYKDQQLVDKDKLSKENSQEIIVLNKRMSTLKHSLDMSEKKFYEENCKLKDDLQKEQQNRLAIRATNNYAPLLHGSDFKTINSNPKYLALRHETDEEVDNLVVLTPIGMDYMRKLGKNVTQYGKERKIGEKDKELKDKLKNTAAGTSAQQLDNKLKLILGKYYSHPLEKDKKAKSKIENYVKKAKLYGYTGNRQVFKTFETTLKKERAEITGILTFKKVFQSLKMVLNSVESVTEDKF